MLQDIRQDADSVCIQTSRGAFGARLLIGADGAHSCVRSLTFPGCAPQYAFGIEAKFHWRTDAPIPAVATNHALFDFGATPNGYGWIFPKRDHFNVGIYRVRKVRRDNSLRQALRDFERLCSILHGCTASARVGHPIPISNGTQPVERGRVILIGDAAGLGESFFGEGIAFAFKSAVIAAEWATAALRSTNGEASGSFRAALDPLIVELRHSFIAARALYELPTSWLDRMAALPVTQDAVLALLQGNAGYRQILWRLVREMPAALVRPGRRVDEGSPFFSAE